MRTLQARPLAQTKATAAKSESPVRRCENRTSVLARFQYGRSTFYHTRPAVPGKHSFPRPRPRRILWAMSRTPQPVSHAGCEGLGPVPRLWPDDQLQEALRAGVPGSVLELQARVRLANRNAVSCWKRELTHTRRLRVDR